MSYESLRIPDGIARVPRAASFLPLNIILVQGCERRRLWHPSPRRLFLLPFLPSVCEYAMMLAILAHPGIVHSMP